MEEEVAALVRIFPFLLSEKLSEIAIFQVIDNGSGMCKAGCACLIVILLHQYLTICSSLR